MRDKLKNRRKVRNARQRQQEEEAKQRAAEIKKERNVIMVRIFVKIFQKMSK